MLSKIQSRCLIKDNFDKNVLGKYPNESELESDHKGKIGHWLEKKLGGDIDSDGNADLNGYECKVQSKKMSWGDWGAPYKIFCDKQFKVFNKKESYENMWFLVESLGIKRNHHKKGIYHSMSGKDVPKYINDLTNSGLSLVEKNSDILMTYSFSKDQRHDKKIKPTEPKIQEKYRETRF